MWYNRLIAALLRSPLHGFLSQNMLLLTYTGRKSGQEYTTPVNYLRMQDAQGAYLATTSLRSRTWWRNLRGGSRVWLQLQGQRLAAQAVVEEDASQVAASLAAYLAQAPALARYYGVALDAAGQPEPGSLAQAAEKMVFIRTRWVG